MAPLPTWERRTNGLASTSSSSFWSAYLGRRKRREEKQCEWQERRDLKEKRAEGIGGEEWPTHGEAKLDVILAGLMAKEISMLQFLCT